MNQPMNILQEYEASQEHLLAIWNNTDNAVDSNSELLPATPIIYCDDEQLLWEAKVEFVAYDYVTIRWRRSGNEYVAIITDLNDIRLNGEADEPEQAESNSQSPE